MHDHAGHGAEGGLCADGLTRYRRAVVKGCTPREDVPDCLLRLGLLVTPPDDPDVLVPVAPDVALAELVRPIEERLERQRGDVRALTDSFSPVHAIYTVAKREHQGWATEIHGERVIGSTLAHAVRSCRDELMTVQPGGRRLAYDLDDLGHLRDGVRHRALFQHAARSHSATLRHLGELVAAGGEVRTLGHVIDRLVVVDRAVAYVPGATGDDGRTSALEIRQPDLVAFLAQVFDDAWERASPLLPSGAPQADVADVADDLRLSTARLLVAGHTDEAIARRLGISRRTVAGRVARLSAELGSGSRAQLGYLIAMSGMLGDGGV